MEEAATSAQAQVARPAFRRQVNFEIVERAIALLNRRRLAKDWERRPNRNALAFLRRAPMRRTLRNLCCENEPKGITFNHNGAPQALVGCQA